MHRGGLQLATSMPVAPGAMRCNLRLRFKLQQRVRTPSGRAPRSWLAPSCTQQLRMGEMANGKNMLLNGKTVCTCNEFVSAFERKWQLAGY